MTSSYRVRYSRGDIEIEVESSEKEYVDAKLAELLKLKLVELAPKAESESASTKPIRRKRTSQVAHATNTPDAQNDASAVTVTALVDAIHQAANFSEIETNILKKRNQLGRILLCFYFAYKQFDQAALTAKQVEEVPDRLGNQIKDTNVSKIIRGRAKLYLTPVESHGDAKLV